jgi:transcriptional regulator with XRE-family HTH domain
VAHEHSEAARIAGERIRARRQELALSQEDVAHLAEMHVTNLGKIERGQANPSLTTLVRIAGALDSDPAVFIAGISADDLPGRLHQLTAADLIAERRRNERRMRPPSWRPDTQN